MPWHQHTLLIVALSHVGAQDSAGQDNMRDKVVRANPRSHLVAPRVTLSHGCIIG